MIAKVSFLHSSALGLLPPSLFLQRHWTLSFSDKALCMISSCRPLVWPQLGLLTKAKGATRAMRFSSSIKYFFKKKYFRRESYSPALQKTSKQKNKKKLPTNNTNPNTQSVNSVFCWIADLKTKLPSHLKSSVERTEQQTACSGKVQASTIQKEGLFRQKNLNTQTPMCSHTKAPLRLLQSESKWAGRSPVGPFPIGVTTRQRNLPWKVWGAAVTKRDRHILKVFVICLRGRKRCIWPPAEAAAQMQQHGWAE